MKHATKKATHAAEQTMESANCALALTQKTAGVVLKSTVATANIANSYVHDLMKVGFDTQAAGMNVAKAYFDSMAEIRKDWINLFAQTGEKAIAATSDIELPFQKEVSEIGKNVVANAQNVFDNFTTSLKNAAAK